MKIIPLCLTGLVVATVATSATAGPAIEPGHIERYWTPARAAEWNSGYAGCMRICQEIGWTQSESAVYCDSRWNHVFNMNRMIPANEKFGK
jgi:hypothetical protein